MPAYAADPLHLKVFIGSPSDVNDERQEAWKVLTLLPSRPAFRGKVFFEAVAWNLPLGKIPLLANIPPQSSVNWIKGEPATCDVAIIILWSRLGTAAQGTDYAKPDGGFFTGTEWEFDNAMKASVASGRLRPKVLLYQRKDELPDKIKLENKTSILKHIEDLEQVEVFIRNCRERGIAINEYQGGASEFASLFEIQLEEIVCKLLEEHTPDNGKDWNEEQSNSIDPNAIAEPFWTGSPFPGLRPFTVKDSPIFFGRGRETDELLSRLRDPDQRFIAVVGASGSGKSSLVWAGLIPRLMNGALEGSEDWAWVRFTPGQLGDNPFIALANGWKDTLEATGKSIRECADTLQQNPEQLDGWLQMALANRPAAAQLLLFIDQFEELFTIVKNPDARTAFVRFLLAASNSTRLRVVISVRADFYAQCVEQGLAEVLKIGSYPLAAPGSYALSQMIAKPAALGGLEFEAGLVDALLEDTGNEPGALPLLAFALERMYQGRTEQGLLTFEAYNGFGRVQGSIGQQADAIFSKLPDDVQATFTHVFRELVEVDERGVPARRRAKLGDTTNFTTQSSLKSDDDRMNRHTGRERRYQDCMDASKANQPWSLGSGNPCRNDEINPNPSSSALNDALINARLLVADGEGEEVTLEVAHEALFRSWGKLAEWVTQTADDHRLRRQIRQLADYWDKNQRKDEHRWPDERVKEVAQMLEHLGMTLEDFPESEQAFLGPINPVDMLKAIEQPKTPHERRVMIGVRLDRLGDTRKGVGLREDGLPDIDWVHVPGGEVTIEIRTESNDPDSAVAKTVTRTVETCWLSRYPVTVAQFQAFLRECHDGQRWQLPQGAPINLPDSYSLPKPWAARLGNHPMDSVNWYDAVAYCHWLSVSLGYEVRLPTEFEWQCAAIGGNDRHSGMDHRRTNPSNQHYPWGEDWNPAQEPWRANTYESDLSRSTAVGMYPGGVSESGLYDLCGTVWEWCLNAFDNPDNVSMDTNPKITRAMRGGSFNNPRRNCRASFRNDFHAVNRSYSGGFRLLCLSPIIE